MRVLLFISSLGGGGAERVAATLGNAWAARGRKVTIVTLAPADRDRYAVIAEVSRISLGVAEPSDGLWHALWANYARLRALRRVLRRDQPDVAIAIMSTSSVLLALASVGLRRTTLIGSERIYPPRVFLGRAWEVLRARLYGRLDSVVVQTSECREWVLANTSARHCAVIPNPILLPLGIQIPIVAPASVGMMGRRRVIGVGRLEAQKGFDLLIDAFGGAAPDFPDWELVIAGDGPLRVDLQSRIDASGLRGRAFLVGRIGNISEWYQSADVFALSSRFEGFPNALLEAMAHGLPSASFDCDTGPRDIVRHEIDGLLVPPNDSGALEHTLRRLMRDNEERERFAGRAVEVCERFGLNGVVGAWEQLFEEVGR